MQEARARILYPASDVMRTGRPAGARGASQNAGAYRLTDCKIVIILGCSIDFGTPLSIFNHMQGTDSLYRETYSTDEAAKELGLSKSTLLRWFRKGRISDVKRDRNNWRVFTTADIERIRKVL